MRSRFNGRKFLFIIPFVLLALAVFTGAVMLLWNNVLAQVVHVSTISFWQALGILVLSKILFGGFRGAQWGRHEWRKRMMQRWEHMSPEEKEKFRNEWQERCGRRFGRPFEEEKAPADR
jgi:membrane protein implicated in regulation of membrane protease activity